MKKYIIFLIIVLILPLKVTASSSTTIMDMDTNRVLYSSNQNEQKLIASITKIMTAIVTIENIDINKKVTVGEEILKSYGSSVYLTIGEEITIKDLLYGLMLRSGNDAAVVLEKNVSNNFIELMNNKAKEIGMENTIFENPSGLDEKTKNYSTSYDMALLQSYAMKNEEFKKIVGTKIYKTNTINKNYIWENKNKLLRNYKYCIGGKTGFTKLAGRTLVTSASKDNINLAVVTLNMGGDFSYHEYLYETYFSLYDKYKILNKNKMYVDNETYYIKNDFYYLLKEEEIDKLKLKINIDTNKKIGYIEVLLDNKVIHKENMVYEKNKKISWWRRLFS